MIKGGLGLIICHKLPFIFYKQSGDGSENNQGTMRLLMGGIILKKRLHTLFQKVWDTQFFKSSKKYKADIERAKELYFINFANHMTMKKNGEFKEYNKFQVSKDTEREWSLEVKDNLVNEICSGSNLLQVVQLSRINLPESEVVDAFKLLYKSPLRDEILTTIEQQKPLFEPNIYKLIIEEKNQDNTGNCSTD